MGGKETRMEHRHRPRPLSRRALLALLIAAGGTAATAPSPAAAAGTAWSCVPYARSVSRVKLRGDAWRWWDAAQGVYARGATPRPGAVLVFKRHNSMRRGHVAVVRQVISNRKILVDHANWGAGRRGKVDKGVAVVDVSVANDWSETRVWYAPVRDYGSTIYPAAGFIYPEPPAARLQTASSVQG
jgi:surface antigen